MRIYKIDEILDRLQTCIDFKIPFSHIRFGDGGIKFIHSIIKKDIEQLNIIVDKEGDLFSAHCLEFDLVGEGSSIEDAEKSIVNNIVNYVTFGISKGLFNKIINPSKSVQDFIFIVVIFCWHFV